MNTTRESVHASNEAAGDRWRPVSVTLSAMAAAAFTIAAITHDNKGFIIAAACLWIGTALEAYLLGRAARR